MADPARCGGDKHLAEQARREAVPDRQTGAATTEFAGRHRLDGDEQVMQTSGAGQPGIESGVGQLAPSPRKAARACSDSR